MEHEHPEPRNPGFFRRLLAWARRRWLLLLVLAAFAVFVILQFQVIVELGRTLLAGALQWIAVAILLQVVYYVVYAVLYKAAFETVEVESHVLDIIPVLLASIFLKLLVPSGGVSAVAVFVDDAARRGQSGARAAEGALLVLVADLATMLPLIAFGLIFLATQGALQLYQVLVAILFVIFTVALSGVLLLGRLQPDRLRDVLERAQRTINNIAARFHRPPLLEANWAEINAAECIGAACNIAAHPRPLNKTLLVAFAVHLINAASLYAVALAYLPPLAVGAIVAAFSVDIVFSVINLIPHGIGIVEGVMALTFISVGVPVAEAVVIALAFRGLNLWLPLLLGSFLLPRVRSFGGGPAQR